MSELYSEIYQVQPHDLDFLGHVNNKSYLDWMEQVAWRHAKSVGISTELQQQLNRILAVHQHQLNYHASCYLNDEIELRTWIGNQIGCCQRERFFEFYRDGGKKMVFSATSVYVCISLDTHKAKKIPQAFITPYQTQKSYQD